MDALRLLGVDLVWKTCRIVAACVRGVVDWSYKYLLQGSVAVAAAAAMETSGWGR